MKKDKLYSYNDYHKSILNSSAVIQWGIIILIAYAIARFAGLI